MKSISLTICLLLCLSSVCATAAPISGENSDGENDLLVVGNPSTAVETFTEAPDSVFVIFPQRVRKDMADYHNYHMDNYVENSLGGRSRIVESTDKHVVVEVGKASSLMIAVIEVKGEKLMAVVETVLTPQPDSAVSFRRLSDWAVVPQQNAITMADFATDRTKTATEMPRMFFKQISYLDDEDVFLFTNTTDGYYVVSEAPDGLATLASSVKARFDGKKWKRVR